MNMKTQLNNIHIFFLCSLIGLTGCGRTLSSTPGDAPNLQKFVEEEKAKIPVQKDTDAIVLPLQQNFVYPTKKVDGTSVRNPFDLPEVLIKETQAEDNRPKEPLESFALDSLKMVGTIGSGTKKAGLVMTPEKVVYRVYIGNYIGQNKGQVVSIEDHAIHITEQKQNALGQLEKASVDLVSE